MESLPASSALFDVYLRLRPSSAVDRERFLDVEASPTHTPTHITIKPPANDSRKRAVDKFAFTRVFEEHVGQREILEATLPLVEGVLGAPGREGRDGLLATLGVTGSGKSHTILGSKAQRGLTQLALDVLFQHTAPCLANIETSQTVFPSLCAADVSEAHLLPATNFLDSIYSDAGPSRAATPALVREQIPYIPGAFPSSFGNSIRLPLHQVSRLKLSSIVSVLHFPPVQLPPHRYVSAHPSSLQSRLQNPSRASDTSQEALPSSHMPFRRPPSSLRHPAGGTCLACPRCHYIRPSTTLTSKSTAVQTTPSSSACTKSTTTASSTCSPPAPPTKTPQKRRALLFKSTEASPDRKVVAGLRKIVCTSLDEALLVLETGLQERRVAGTGSNASSSRSHGFFCIEVKKRRHGSIPAPWTSSTLTIVDLAGSERARAAKTAGATLAEAGKINESLMYLGQCMQMQSDNAQSTASNLVPFRQCKLTELLFSNSFATPHGAAAHHKAPQKAIMIVTADPLGDFNATSQILRYSALAREVTVPRIPSVSSTILAGALGKSNPTRPSTPSAMQEELEWALNEVARLREELEVSCVLLQEETHRRQEVEASWKVAEGRIDAIEAEVREELWAEMDAKLLQQQRRWRAARDEEEDRQDEHLDAKLELLTRGMRVWEDETAEKENVEVVGRVEEVEDLEFENVKLKERLAMLEREREVQRSPSKKMRVLKTRKWEGSGMGLDDD